MEKKSFNCCSLFWKGYLPEATTIPRDLLANKSEPFSAFELANLKPRCLAFAKALKQFTFKIQNVTLVLEIGKFQNLNFKLNLSLKLKISMAPR